MLSIPSKSTGSTYLASEFEGGSVREVQNIITDTGIALSGADLNQLGKAVSEYVAGASFYVEGGGSAADAYVLAAIGSKKTPTQYFDGLEIVFRVTNSNTGASTVALPGLAAVDLKKDNGATDLSGGDLLAGTYAAFRYDSAAGDFDFMWSTTAGSAGDLPRGYIDGLVMSNNGVDSDHDIDTTIGVARSSDDSIDMTATAFTKRIDANWVAGSGNGGFPSALSIAIDTWYHYFIISTPGGTIDFGFDSSLTATNLLTDATGYTKIRRIGSVLTDGSSNIIGFYSKGDDFWWNSAPTDFSGSAPGSFTNVTLSVPLGVETLARTNTQIISSGIDGVAFKSNVTTTEWVVLRADTERGWSRDRIWADTSSQIKHKADTGTPATYFLFNLGWTDLRGKDS